MGEGGNISYSSEVSEAIIVCPLFTENVFLAFPKAFLNGYHLLLYC